MLFEKKQKNEVLVEVLVLLGLFFGGSLGLAQSDWIPKANIPTARTWASSCLLDGKIYVIGGTTGTHFTGSAVGTNEVYDPILDSWDTTKAAMPTPRVEFCVAAVNGKIYAIGGALTHPGLPFGVVEEYDPLTDSWDTNKTPMPTARKGAAWGVISNKIYVAGGTTTGSDYVPSDKLEIYDPATDTWDVTKAALPKAIYSPRAAVLNDKLYVIGGLIGSPWAGQNDTQIYDQTTDTWSYGADLNDGRVGHSADVISGKIYAIAGDPQFVMLRSVEEYDPGSDSWMVIDQTPHGLTLHCTHVIGDKIYICSGSTTTIYPNPTPSSAVYIYDPVVSYVPQNTFMPDVFALHQNYPNPFNPITIINYELPITNDVSLSIYNLLGQRVATLVNKRQQAGFHQVEWDASHFSSGVYYYRIEAGEFRDVKKMILIR